MPGLTDYFMKNSQEARREAAESGKGSFGSSRYNYRNMPNNAAAERFLQEQKGSPIDTSSPVGRQYQALREYEFGEIQMLMQAGITDPEVLFYGRETITPDEVNAAAVLSLVGDNVSGGPTDSVTLGLAGMMRQGSRALPERLMDRYNKTNRWIFADAVDVPAARSKRIELIEQIHAGEQMPDNRSGNAKLIDRFSPGRNYPNKVQSDGKHRDIGPAAKESDAETWARNYEAQRDPILFSAFRSRSLQEGTRMNPRYPQDSVATTVHGTIGRRVFGSKGANYAEQGLYASGTGKRRGAGKSKGKPYW